MTNRLELNWKVDGFVDEQRYYCSETEFTTETKPAPKAVLTNDVRTYTDTMIEEGKTYYVAVSSVKNGIEKLSNIVEIKTTLNPITLLPLVYFDASDLELGSINSWTCRVTGVPVTGSAMPTATGELGFRTCKFSASSVLSSSNAAFASLMNNKTQGSVFIVFKKDIVDTSSQSRRIFNLTTPSSAARFAIYADDQVSGNLNKLVVGGRRLDSNAYKYLATPTTIDTNLHMLYGDVDHNTATFGLSIDGGVKLTGATTQGTGATSATNGAIWLGGGAANVGFIGHLACVLFFDRVLNQSDRQKLEGWAAQKYGLMNNLPIDHPYKILVPTV